MLDRGPTVLMEKNRTHQLLVISRPESPAKDLAGCHRLPNALPEMPTNSARGGFVRDYVAANGRYDALSS